MNDPGATPSAGTRFGRMMGAEPELTEVRVDEAGQEMIRRFVAYVSADGFDVGSMVARMERLKFEMIVREQSYGEVLADLEGS